MARALIPAELIEFNSPTETIRELKLSFKDDFKLPFKAGQFVTLHVPYPEKTVRRAYSIASSHSVQNEITLLFKLVPGGIASEYVRKLSVGDTLEFTGPFGRLFFKTPIPENIYFFCTGAGVSQHYSYLLSHADELQNSKIKMHFGVWNENEIFYRKELDQLSEKIANFSYEIIIDEALNAQSWKGRTGHVTQAVDECTIDNEKSVFYLCGNPAMIKSMKELLSDRGLEKSQIIAEAFR